MKLIMTIVALLATSAVYAADCSPQRLRFDMGDQVINTRRGDSGIIQLRRMLRDQYGIRPADYDLQLVRLLAKSKGGNGMALLVVGNNTEDRARVEGHPSDFDSARNDTYHSVHLDNRSGHSGGRWQVQVEGVIKIKNMVAVVKERNCGGGDGGYHGSLTCRWNGANNQPYDRNQGVFIGKLNHGFTYVDGCQRAVDGSRNNVVCNWNGSGYTPYGIYGNVNIGKSDYGFTQLDSCNKAVADSEDDLICNWTGSGYSPYRVSNGVNVGKPHYGFTNYSSCAANIRVQRSQVVCNWNGSNYQPYAIRSNLAIGVDGYGYTQVGKCHQAVRGISYNEVCNWDGNGYAKYHINNPSRALARYRNLESCLRVR